MHNLPVTPQTLLEKELKEQNTNYRLRIRELEQALQKIVNWEMPETGRFHDEDQTEPMSYSYCFGSNGERDYIRNLANIVLTKSTIQTNPGENNE